MKELPMLFKTIRHMRIKVKFNNQRQNTVLARILDQKVKQDIVGMAGIIRMGSMDWVSVVPKLIS